MSELFVVPEALMGAAGQIAGITGQLLAANATHAAITAAILAPGSDPVSVKTAAGLVGHGLAHHTMAALGTEEAGRSAGAVAESGASYLMGDTQAGAAYTAAGGV